MKFNIRLHPVKYPEEPVSEYTRYILDVIEMKKIKYLSFQPLSTFSINVSYMYEKGSHNNFVRVRIFNSNQFFSDYGDSFIAEVYSRLHRKLIDSGIIPTGQDPTIHLPINVKSKNERRFIY